VQNVCFWLYGCVRIALEIPTQNDEELTIRQTFNIHGDNIVECVRAFDYVLSGLSTLVLDVAGPILSVTCPVYIVTLPKLRKKAYTKEKMKRKYNSMSIKKRHKSRKKEKKRKT
jgi:hypothetical protein